MIMGVARIFQRGDHTDSYIGYSPNCHLNIVGCLLTKRLTKGGSRAPQDPPPPPGYALDDEVEDMNLDDLFDEQPVLPESKKQLVTKPPT